jgi:hypothetical protein
MGPGNRLGRNGGSRRNASARTARGGPSAGSRPASAVGSSRRLAEPVQVQVSFDQHGRPTSVAGREVAAVRDSWLVEDRWWTKAPIRRRYYEVVTTAGAVEVVYREPGGRWLRHQ